MANLADFLELLEFSLPRLSACKLYVNDNILVVNSANFTFQITENSAWR